MVCRKPQQTNIHKAIFIHSKSITIGIQSTVLTIAMATAKTAVAKKRFRRAAASNLRARRCKGYVSDQAHRCASRARKPTIGWTISSPAAARKGTHMKPASKRPFKGAVHTKQGIAMNIPAIRTPTRAPIGFAERTTTSRASANQAAMPV